MKIYTLGYQNLTAELYVKSLVDAGVGLVIDVRENAWSQRPDFIKSNLSRRLDAAGINYRHAKNAGNPSENRKNSRTAAECLFRYRRHLKNHPESVVELLTLAIEAHRTGRPACLTCYERETKNCHRSVLVAEMSALEPLLIPYHLEPTLNEYKKSTEKARSPLSDAFLSPALLPFT